MAIEVSDLVPQASGSASLGAEMTNGDFTGMTAPFAHMHMNSGVWHDHILGQSGIIRFNLGDDLSHGIPAGTASAFELSCDGGKSFPLRLGMYKKGRSNTLPSAYIGTPNLTNLDIETSGLLSLVGRQGIQLICDEDTGNGLISLLSFADISISALDEISIVGKALELIATDGITQEGDMTPSLSGLYHLGFKQGNAFSPTIFRPYASIHQNSGVFHNALGMSGVIRFGPRQFEFNFGSTDYPLNIRGLTTPRSVVIENVDNDSLFLLRATAGDITIDASAIGATRGILQMFGDNQVFIQTNENMELDAEDLAFQIGTSIDGTTTIGDISYRAAQQLNLSAFNGSGVFEYRGGPFQSWFMHTSADPNGSGPFADGYWPIAHSGHVNRMIQASRQNIEAGGSGLQRQYSAGSQIIMTNDVTSPNPKDGYLMIVANTARVEFSSFGTLAEINISGLFTPPTLSSLVTGDLYMMNHSVISGIAGTTTSAVAKAKALGYGGLVIQTGSGIINLMTGSGIAQWANVGTQTLTTVAQNVNLTTALGSADMNYGLGVGLTSGVITIFSPGLYRLSYKIAIDKTVGTTPQTCTIEATQNASAILGTTTNTFHFNSTTAASNSASCVCVFNAEPNDKIAITALSSTAGTQNCRIQNRGCLVVIEKIGPKRGTAGS